MCNYSTLAKTLIDLIKRKLPKLMSWMSECEKTFQTLKEELVSAPVLQTPDFSHQFLVQTDAYIYCLGAVLSSIIEHTILYPSRKLFPRVVALVTFGKMCLVTMWGLQNVQHYPYCHCFTVINNYNSLSWLNHVAGENDKLLH